MGIGESPSRTNPLRTFSKVEMPGIGTAILWFVVRHANHSSNEDHSNYKNIIIVFFLQNCILQSGDFLHNKFTLNKMTKKKINTL